jgi:TatD DNase family protein
VKVPPPLDLHAHVATTIAERDLRELGAFICVATRSLAEYEAVRNRRDVRTLWGVGVHPGLVGAQKAFNIAAFAAAVATTPFVTEVGIDGGSRVPMELQLEVFRAVLDQLTITPRLVSVHSNGAHVRVLRELSRRPVKGVILHWWTGSAELTEEAVRLGCYFSLPPASMGSLGTFESVPVDRLLPETDHPDGDRRGPLPRRPGNLKEVETRLGADRGLDQYAMRIQFWRNLLSLVDDVGVGPLIPNQWFDVLDQIRRG